MRLAPLAYTALFIMSVAAAGDVQAQETAPPSPQVGSVQVT